MKMIFITVVLLALVYYVKAQDHTLGKSKNEIRSMIRPNTGISLLKGSRSDTLTMNGGLQIVMYYKNDTCFTSKSTIPLSLQSLITEKMHTGYKQVKENTWISPSGLVKVQLTISKEKHQLYIETTLVSDTINKQ